MPTMPQGFSPTIAGYSSGAPAGVMRVETAGGAPRYSLDWDRGTQAFQVSMLLDRVQYGVWIAFYTYAIKKGAIAFDMPLDSGFGMATHSANIVPGTYSVDHTAGTHVTVNFTAEAASGAYDLTDGDVADYVSTYGLSADTMPAGLRPILGGYGHNGPDGAMRDDTSGGVAAYALDWAGGLQQFTCTMILTPLQFQLWAVWYHRLIAKGAYTFSMPLESGFGVVPHNANIMPGSYTMSRNGTVTVVSFSVEAESTVYALGEAAALELVDIYGVYGPGMMALFNRLQIFVTVDSPVLDF